MITTAAAAAAIYMVVVVQCLQLAGRGHCRGGRRHGRGRHRRGHARRRIGRSLSAPQTRVRRARVQCHRGDVVVGHHLEDYVLVPVAERRPERIRRVCRAGAVQHHRTIAGRQPAADLVPL